MKDIQMSTLKELKFFYHERSECRSDVPGRDSMDFKAQGAGNRRLY